jgi:hypothetical protein
VFIEIRQNAIRQIYKKEKMKLSQLFLICGIVFIQFGAFGQEYSFGKGTSMISGMGNFSCLKANSDSKFVTEITLTPSYNYFLFRNFFVGAGMSYKYQNLNDPTTGSIVLGPHIGYTFGNEYSSAIPYLNLGLSYQLNSYDFESSWDVAFQGRCISYALGVIIPIKSHLGVAIEGKYNAINFKAVNLKAGEVSLNFGLVGMIF